MVEEKINLTIIASGNGTNAENIALYFAGHDQIQVSQILSNKADAFVLERAKKQGIPFASFSRGEFDDESLLGKLKSTDYIILAGFLWLIPKYLIDAFSNRILNIHPSLLPKYGGKGMFGSRVHEAVVEAAEKESGITIHLVNEDYDKGKILFQSKCIVE